MEVKRMKVWYIIGVLALLLFSGCATQTTEPTTPAPTEPETTEPETTEPETTEPAVEEEPVPEETAPAGEEVSVTSLGFEPSELTVEVGTTVIFKSVVGKHKLTVAGEASPNLEEGDVFEKTFDQAGSHRAFDIFTKKSATITVTEEEPAEETTE